MRNAVSWVVMPRGSCKNRRFGGTYLHHEGEEDERALNIDSSNWQLKLLTLFLVRPILVTLLLTEALGSTKTPVITRATRRYIPEDTSFLLPQERVHQPNTDTVQSSGHFHTLFNFSASLIICIQG
jgi:hypothetical protein